MRMHYVAILEENGWHLNACSPDIQRDLVRGLGDKARSLTNIERKVAKRMHGRGNLHVIKHPEADRLLRKTRKGDKWKRNGETASG